MSNRTCLNPDCKTEVNVIGVCIACANSNWDPTKTGVECNSSLVTGGENKDMIKPDMPGTYL